MNKRGSIVVLLAVGSILACNFPVLVNTSAVPTDTPLPVEVEVTPILVDEPITETATVALPTLAPAPPTLCSPQLTANSPVNVRLGPGTAYDIIGALNTAQTAAIDGRNSESTWWYIVFPSGSGGRGWVAASVTTASCNAASVRIVAAPPMPTEAEARVTDISVSVDPSTISVPGCIGPLLPSTASATIEVSGPMKFKWHFNTDQLGPLPTQTLNFTKAGAKEVSDTFTPVLLPGAYWVRLVIEGVNTSGFNIQAKYKISC